MTRSRAHYDTGHFKEHKLQSLYSTPPPSPLIQVKFLTFILTFPIHFATKGWETLSISKALFFTSNSGQFTSNNLLTNIMLYSTDRLIILQLLLGEGRDPLPPPPFHYRGMPTWLLTFAS